MELPPAPAPAPAADERVHVRLAAPQDMPLVRDMIRELAEFEGVPDGPQISVEDLVRDGFEARPAWFFVLLAERRGPGTDTGTGTGPGIVLGQALCSRAYSSWTRRAFYVEDLFVRPAARRAGVGLALMSHLAKMAVAEGVARVDWHVLESNAGARAFYARLGARDLRRRARPAPRCASTRPPSARSPVPRPTARPSATTLKYASFYFAIFN